MRRCIHRFALAPLLVALAGFDCAGSEPETPVEPSSVFRQWEFAELSRNGGARLVGPPGVQVDGTVSEDHVYGPMLIFPPEVDRDATAEVFSSENGFTYWVSTQAPHVTSPAPTAIVGSQAALGQVQHFRKTDADATLTFKVTRSFLDVIDSNGNLPSALECPWRTGSSFADCARVMNAWVELEITARRLPDGDAFFAQAAPSSSSAGRARSISKSTTAAGDSCGPPTTPSSTRTSPAPAGRARSSVWRARSRSPCRSPRSPSGKTSRWSPPPRPAH